MLRSPKTCRQVGCFQAAVRGTNYCEKHTENNTAIEQKKFSDRHQNPWDKWYDWAVWANLRTLVLARDPVCKDCGRAASTEADHIVPHRGDWDKFTDLNNLQGLCHTCHSRKSGREDGGFGNRVK